MRPSVPHRSARRALHRAAAALSACRVSWLVALAAAVLATCLAGPVAATPLQDLVFPAQPSASDADADAGADSQAEADAEADAGAATDGQASEADSDPREVDARIEEQLSTRLALVPGLEDVVVSATAGVVTLRGEVADEADRALAETLARGVDEVVEVRNRTSVAIDLSTRLQPALEAATERLQRLVAALPLLLVAAALVWLFAWLGRWLSQRERLFRRARHNPFLDTLLRQVVRTVLLLIGVLVALDLLGATALVGAVLGTAGLIGLALGFAFRDLVENYIASILLSLRQPFAPNDHVVIDGHEGKVVSLNSRATTLMTLEGNHLRLPNATVFKGVLLNYTRNPKRQFSVIVGVGNDEDPAEAQRIGLAVLRAMKGVLADPEPTSAIMELADSSVTVRFFAWIDQREASWLKVRSEAMRLVKQALDEAGIDLPEPGYRVQLLQPDAPLPDRPRRAVSAERLTEQQADVSVGYELDEQIDDERARPQQREQDLLDPNAPRE